MQVLANEKLLNDVVDKLIQEKNGQADAKTTKELIRSFLQKNGKDLGLPPLRADEMVVLLYDAVFADVEETKNTPGSEENFMVVLKEILVRFAEQLEANPVFHDLGI